MFKALVLTFSGERRRTIAHCLFAKPTVWFTSPPAGHNKLGNVVSKICKDAEPQGQFSNHSLRATTATRGLESGNSDKLIMERTGHQDIRSLQRHQRPDVSIKIEISKALNCRSERSVGEREAESSLKREVDQLVDDEVKRFCQDDNNATVKGSNSVVFQNCSFVISKDLKFS